MLDSTHHMTKILFGRKNRKCKSYICDAYMCLIRFRYLSCGLSTLLHGIISLPDDTSYDG